MACDGSITDDYSDYSISSMFKTVLKLPES